MQTATDTSAVKAQGSAHAEPQTFSKRIGQTTFVVSVHFSRDERETMQDKLLRLIESEVRRSA